MITIDFPKILSSQYFYAFIAKEINRFINQPIQTDATLVINCSMTSHIQPDALCSLLCYLRRVEVELPNSRIFMQFGSSVTLLMYLYRTKFALLAKFGSRIQIDMNLPSIDSSSVTANTHSIRQLNYIGLKEDIELYGFQKAWATFEGKLRDTIQKDLSAVCAKNIDLFSSIQEYYDMSESFFQIAQNAAEHAIAMNVEVLQAFLTFQYYQKTGLTFAICDTGSSLYSSLAEQYERKTRNAQYGFQGKPLHYPLIFSRNDFSGNNARWGATEKSIAAILETICYRISERKGKFGLTYVLEHFLLHNIAPQAIITIHSGQASIVISEALLEELFIIKGTDKDRYIDSVNHDKCLAFLYNWKCEDSVVSYAEAYGGTEICVRIPPKQRKVSL